MVETTLACLGDSRTDIVEHRRTLNFRAEKDECSMFQIDENACHEQTLYYMRGFFFLLGGNLVEFRIAQ